MSLPTLHFPGDFIASAINHLDFLSLCDQVADLKDDGVLRQALFRYQHFWLPLAAKYGRKVVLEAPLDIAWVWHCHMLSPVAYCSDCIRLLDGVVVDHSLEGDEKTRKKHLQETQKIWQMEYPDDVFDVPLNTETVVPRYKDGRTDFSYDIIAAAGRQKEFGYQVSLPHYRDRKYLESSLVRYRKFLHLKIHRPRMFIVPCYDIDLMWHTHQLHPLAYKADMEALFGKIFNHDDSVNDRNEGSKLYNADLATREAWKEVFDENFATFGAMYRGENPVGKLSRIKNEGLLSMRTKSANLVFEKFELKTSPNISGKRRLQVSTAVNSRQVAVIAKLKGSEKVWQGKSLCSVIFDTRSVNCLKFSLVECTGWGFFGSRTLVAETTFDMLSLIENLQVGQPSVQELSTCRDSNIQVDFKVAINSIRKGPMLLFLNAGLFERAIMPENLEEIWGPIPLPRLPPGADNWCEVASHKVINHRGASLFTCRLIHSLALMQSAVHVFYHDKMVAVGHLLGTDQLPIPTQVSKRTASVTLNPRAGERAILIKNHKGDWAIVVGRWTGLRKGVPGVLGRRGQRGKRGVPGSPGTLHVKIWRMDVGFMQELILSYDQKIYSMHLSGAVVDLKAGTVLIEEKCDDVAETLALAFSISLLHVLCQPRPKGWEPYKSTQSAGTRGSRYVTAIPAEDMAFVMAAGFLMSTPSNHYVRERYGEHACAGCGGGGGEIEINDIADMDCGSFGGGDNGIGDDGAVGGGDDGAACGGCGGCGGAGDGGGVGGCGGAGCGAGGCGGGGCGGCAG